MTHYIEFSERELELLEEWKKLVEQGFKTDMDTKAAINLGISPVTVRTRRSRLRSKYERQLAFCKKYRSYQQYFFQKTGGKFNPLSRSGKAVRK